MPSLFDIHIQGDIGVLIGLSSADLLGQPIHHMEYGFLPSSLSPDLSIMQSKLSNLLLVSGTMGIDAALMDIHFPSFTISRVEFEGISNMLKSGRVMNLYRVVIEDSVCDEIKPTLNLNMMKVEEVAEKAAPSASAMCKPANDVLVSNMISGTHDCECDVLGKYDYKINFRQNNLQNYCYNKSEIMESGQQVKGQTVRQYHNNLSNMQCETLGKFIAQEFGVMINTPRCEFHEKINGFCKDCAFILDGMSLVDLQSYRDNGNSVTVVTDSNLQQRLMTEFSYKDPVYETFGPKKSNYAEARGSA